MVSDLTYRSIVLSLVCKRWCLNGNYRIDELAGDWSNWRSLLGLVVLVLGLALRSRPDVNMQLHVCSEAASPTFPVESNSATEPYQAFSSPALAPAIAAGGPVDAELDKSRPTPRWMQFRVCSFPACPFPALGRMRHKSLQRGESTMD